MQSLTDETELMSEIKDRFEWYFKQQEPRGTAAEQLAQRYQSKPLFETRDLSITKSSVAPLLTGSPKQKGSTIHKRRSTAVASPGAPMALLDYIDERKKAIQHKTTILEAIERQARFLN